MTMKNASRHRWASCQYLIRSIEERMKIPWKGMGLPLADRIFAKVLFKLDGIDCRRPRVRTVCNRARPEFEMPPIKDGFHPRSEKNIPLCRWYPFNDTLTSTENFMMSSMSIPGEQQSFRDFQKYWDRMEKLRQGSFHLSTFSLPKDLGSLLCKFFSFFFFFFFFFKDNLS